MKINELKSQVRSILNESSIGVDASILKKVKSKYIKILNDMLDDKVLMKNPEIENKIRLLQVEIMDLR